jgi:pimeloyl-ACP methyl ester carboxylesterase
VSVGRELASRLGGAVDRALLSALRHRYNSSRLASASRADRRAMLVEVSGFYNQPEVGVRYFAAPAAARPFTAARGGAVVDLKWESAFEAVWPTARAEYAAHEANRWAYARMLRQPSPAPTLICLHGYRGGNFVLEEHAFAARFFHRLGLNVVLFTLPLHGKRAAAGAPVWPSVNVARTNEGFAHAVHDVRALMRWLDETQEGRPIAVCGMSLGGYTTALLATVEKLAFAAPMIPVASFPDLLWAHGAGRPERARAEREGITHELLRTAMAVHTPTERAPSVAPEQMLVLSAAGDRIAPPEHASRLAAHFGAEELRFVGGHLLQLGRADAFRAIARRLAALGLISRRR